MIGKRLRNFALTKPVRSELWKRKIKAMQCTNCHHLADDPHHIFGSVHGLKSSDICIVPLCRTCHEYFEEHGLTDELIEACFKIMHEYIRDILENKQAISSELIAPIPD